MEGWLGPYSIIWASENDISSAPRLAEKESPRLYSRMDSTLSI
jgi:hypothetical protein